MGEPQTDQNGCLIDMAGGNEFDWGRGAGPYTLAVRESFGEAVAACSAHLRGGTGWPIFTLTNGRQVAVNPARVVTINSHASDEVRS